MTQSTFSLANLVRTTGMNHITMQSGHSRVTMVSEIHPEAIELLTQLIQRAEEVPGAVPMPTAEKTHSLEMEMRESSITITIVSKRASDLGEALPVVTIGVGLAPARDIRLWRDLHSTSLLPTVTRASAPPKRAWVAVRFEPGMLTQELEFISMLGDFERCIAWAFVEYLARRDMRKAA